MQPAKTDVDAVVLIRILLRWRKYGAAVFMVFSSLGVLCSLKLPPRYEAQAIIEKRAPPVSTKISADEFSMTRFTSETQRSVTLLKSPQMTQAWLSALGMLPSDTAEMEKEVKRFQGSLAVRPVNFTDMFVLKVTATSPDDAKRRLEALMSAYTDWETSDAQRRSEDAISLLRGQIRRLEVDLAGERTSLKGTRQRGPLELSGSVVENDAEMRLRAKENLYEKLLLQLEDAERLLTALKTDSPIHVAAPPTVARDMSYSPSRMILAGILLGLFAGLAAAFLLEWADPSVRRVGDLRLRFPLVPIIPIPRLPEWARHVAEPVVDDLSPRVRDKGRAVVQVAGPVTDPEKREFCAHFAREMSLLGLRPCVIRRGKAAPPEVSACQTAPVEEIFWDGRQILTKTLEDCKGRFDVLILNVDADPDDFLWKGPHAAADILCLLLSAGETRRSWVDAARNIQRGMEGKKTVLFLQNAEDPLPRWLRR